MMMNIRKKHLAVAVAGVVSLGASVAQAAEFNASTTLQNTLTVISLQDFDAGTVFATATGAALSDGVGALVISPDGTVTDPGDDDSATVNLTSLSSPVPAQGSVAIASSFNLQLPDTKAILATSFPDNTDTTLDKIATDATELVHESGNPVVPSLYLMHFTVGDVSGGTSAATGTLLNINDGKYFVTWAFGEPEYVFNIGATLTTKPNSAGAEDYQAGIYSGTFEVTAAY